MKWAGVVLMFVFTCVVLGAAQGRRSRPATGCSADVECKYTLGQHCYCVRRWPRQRGQCACGAPYTRNECTTPSHCNSLSRFDGQRCGCIRGGSSRARGRCRCVLPAGG